MMMRQGLIQVEITNTQALEAMLDGMEGIDRDRAIRSSLARGGQALRRGGMSRLRQRMENPYGYTGNLLRAFTVRVKRRKPGVLTGFRGGQEGGSHAHLVDMGTERRPHPLTGTSGRMPANWFWTDTRSQDMPKAYRAIEQGLAQFVARVQQGRRQQ